MLLADGVGMGKTYEALATAVGWLQHKGFRRQRWSPRVLVLVPPALVRKWRDEVFLPDRWPKYLKQIERQDKIFECFSRPVIIQRSSNLDELADRKIHRRLAGGFYVVNWMQLSREGSGKWASRRRNLIKRTPWDVVIIDEAHLLPGQRIADLIEVVGHRGTRIILLTATPFQLETGELKELFATLFLPDHSWDAYRAADGAYAQENFQKYRRQLRMAMTSRDSEKQRALAEASRVRRPTEKFLGRLMIRNPSVQGRDFWLVDKTGVKRKIAGIAESTEEGLKSELGRGGMVNLSEEDRYYYLAGLERLLPVRQSPLLDRSHFDGFRHLLSSFSNFKECKVGRTRLGGSSLEHFLQTKDDSDHPRVSACVELVDRIVKDELLALSKGKDYLGKTVIFVRFVSGTLPALKRAIQQRLQSMLDSRRVRGRNHPYLELRRTVDSFGSGLTDTLQTLGSSRPKSSSEALRLLATLKKTLGNPDAKPRSQMEGYARAVARLALAGSGLKEEQKLLQARLREAQMVSTDLINAEDEGVQIASLEERLRDILESLCDRYKARDIVQTISGDLEPEEAAARRTAFNAPGAPLVLIASPVGQVGVDLQAYAEHVIHYELEWNPAKMEQREGRVDRLGRRGSGKVNVYYLLCEGTYDERMFLQISRRQLWHKLIVGKHRELETESEDIVANNVADLDQQAFRRLALDLRPK